MDEKCIHRTKDCFDVQPGISQCRCGQLFAFVAGVGCGRYKKFEELTDADKANFSPEMADEFRRFMTGARTERA
jgi:hypothetical protein